jgi:2-polyprenyl-3-methyl-5-hydroxy-6-metoxy-1,4-benzoquinol methylase
MQEAGTVIVEHYRESATQDAGDVHYRGLRIHALEGLHEFVGDMAARVFEPGSQVLDLAAGTGAMCLRLKDLEMNPTGCDLVVENFRLHESVPFVSANFNQVFPVEFLDRFEGVVASEIIEHLENPRHFLRQVFSVLKPGGQLILTTPNVDNAFSRAMLVRFGTFNWFRQQQYEIDGHITPLPLMVLRNAMAEAGFNFLEVTSVGECIFSFWSWWKLHILAALLRLVDHGHTQQKEILVILAQKPWR